MPGGKLYKAFEGSEHKEKRERANMVIRNRRTNDTKFNQLQTSNTHPNTLFPDSGLTTHIKKIYVVQRHISCIPASRNVPLGQKWSRYFERRQITLAAGHVLRHESLVREFFIISLASEPPPTKNYPIPRAGNGWPPSNVIFPQGDDVYFLGPNGA